MSICALASTDQTPTYITMSLGEIHGRLWRGKRFQCCGRVKSDFLNLSKSLHHSRPHWLVFPTHHLTLSSLFYFLTWISCISSFFYNLYCLPSSSHSSPEIPPHFWCLNGWKWEWGSKRRQASVLPFGTTSELFFCHSWQKNELSDSVTNFYFPTPGKRKQRPPTRCSSVSRRIQLMYRQWLIN